MLERSFGLEIRNFSTLFLLIATLTVPLHLAYSLVFRNVIETRELHEVIATFPPVRQVRSVGQTQLTQARVGLIIVTALELAAIPWLAQATARAIRRRDDDSVMTLGMAFRGARPSLRLGRIQPGPLVVSAVVAFLIAFLVERSGLLLLEFVSDARSFPFFGLMQGVSRALGGPFLLTTIVCSQRTKETGAGAPNLY